MALMKRPAPRSVGKVMEDEAAPPRQAVASTLSTEREAGKKDGNLAKYMRYKKARERC